MSIKRYFDGSTLVEVVLPDPPPPNFSSDTSVNSLITPQNPTGVDPTLLRVDAAGVPDLIPTQGAPSQSTKFPDPLPGDGRGAGVGQPSGPGLRDEWANNPLKDPNTVESVQSGEIGSALPEEQRAAPRAGFEDPEQRALSEATAPLRQRSSSVDTINGVPDETWTKSQLGQYIVAQGGTPPSSSENKDAFLKAAQEQHAAGQDLA